MKPILKWVGGKTQILNEVLARFPKTIQDQHEPFLGGGSVLLGFLEQVQEGSIELNGSIQASDLNPVLIQFYTTVQAHPEELIHALQEIVNAYRNCVGETVDRNPVQLVDPSKETYYYWIRNQFNQLPKDTIQSSARFLFLNKTCFRGLYREGPRGFNVPQGNQKNPQILDEDHIRAVSQHIQAVHFMQQSFDISLSKVGSGDFVQLDPPQAPENATSFVGYTADGFPHHEQLFAICKKLESPFLMSNSNVPLVTDSFQGPQTVHVIQCKRSIHSKNPSATTTEVLITPSS